MPAAMRKSKPSPERDRSGFDLLFRSVAIKPSLFFTWLTVKWKLQSLLATSEETSQYVSAEVSVRICPGKTL
jgi:hypothetical protein